MRFTVLGRLEQSMSKRLGSVLITAEGRRVVFRDAHDHRLFVTIEDADIVDLILLLYEWSDRAAAELRVELRSEQTPPEAPDSN